MPRGLYGRAALILIVPIVTIQLVVSIVFVQRHFEGVTRQMVHNIANDIGLVLGTIAGAQTPGDAYGLLDPITRELQFTVSFIDAVATPVADTRRVIDLSGIAVIDAFHEVVPKVSVVDLASDSRAATLYIDTHVGMLELTFARGRVSASNPHQLLVFMILTSLIMTVIAFLFLRNQLRPIRRLARAAEAFGKGRVVPYAPSGALEVRSAGRAFLDMRGRIERQIEQRTLMLSGVSHDLRTPLTRMRLALSLLPDDREAEDLGRDLGDMERMIDEFLAFARGDQSEVLAAQDPVALARDAVDGALRSGLDVTLHVPDVPPTTTVCRPLALRRALDNLILNAGRYGSRVEVSVELDPATVVFAVEDDGPGIPAEKRAEAVRPFTRLDTARNQDVGPGVGLGLAITDDIARNHGGHLTLGVSARLGGLSARIDIPR